MVSAATNLKVRIIPCLDVRDGRVVKGTRFVDLVDAGDPVESAARYAAEGADEIVYLDISATPEGRGAVREVIERTARSLFVPLTVGGGVRSCADAERLLRAGADRIAVNSAAVERNSRMKCACMLRATSSHDSGVNQDSGETAFSALRTPRSARLARPIRMIWGRSSTSIECAIVV